MIGYGTLTTDPFFGLPLQEPWPGPVSFTPGVFLSLDGFDFGTRAIFATRDDSKECETLLAAIGPFWDNSEVWLVVFGGALFVAFPTVHTNLFSRHYLLIFTILETLALHGLTPKTYEQHHDETWQTWWGRAFVISSVSAPFFLSVFTTCWFLGVESLLSLPDVVVNLIVVALTVIVDVGFLVMRTRGSLQRDTVGCGPRAMATYLTLVIATLGYLIAIRSGLGTLALIPLALVVVSLAAATGYLLALRGGRCTLAFETMPVLVFVFITLMAMLMLPLTNPATELTVTDAVISVLPLNIMSVASALPLSLVFIYFDILCSTFSGPIGTGESYSWPAAIHLSLPTSPPMAALPNTEPIAESLTKLLILLGFGLAVVSVAVTGSALRDGDVVIALGIGLLFTSGVLMTGISLSDKSV